MLYDVPAYTWVTLAYASNNVNAQYAAGDKCVLVKGGIVEVIRTDPKGTLVRFSMPAGTVSAGSSCPDGALVFLPIGLPWRTQ